MNKSQVIRTVVRLIRTVDRVDRVTRGKLGQSNLPITNVQRGVALGDRRLPFYAFGDWRLAFAVLRSTRLRFYSKWRFRREIIEF